MLNSVLRQEELQDNLLKGLLMLKRFLPPVTTKVPEREYVLNSGRLGVNASGSQEEPSWVDVSSEDVSSDED